MWMEFSSALGIGPTLGVVCVRKDSSNFCSWLCQEAEYLQYEFQPLDGVHLFNFLRKYPADFASIFCIYLTYPHCWPFAKVNHLFGLKVGGMWFEAL